MFTHSMLFMRPLTHWSSPGVPDVCQVMAGYEAKKTHSDNVTKDEKYNFRCR